MSSTCVTSLDLCAIRVAQLNTGGAPVAGASNGYVSNAPVKLQVKVTTEKGDDLTKKNGCGIIAATYQSPAQMKGLELSLDLCQLDAELIALMTGSTVISSGGNAVGFQLPEVGSSPSPICFEAWTKAWSSDSQLVAPVTDPEATWLHWVFPMTRWVQGDFTLEHDLLIVPLSGVCSENVSITSNGPFDDWPSEIVSLGGITRLCGWFYDTEYPDADLCTYTSVTSAAS